MILRRKLLRIGFYIYVVWCDVFVLGQIATLLRQLPFKNTPCNVFDSGWECITMPPALSPGVDISPETCQSVLWRVASSTRTLTCFTAEQQRESKRGERLGMGAEGRGSERTEHKIPSVLGWMAHFLAWREQLWIQFVPLANCVPQSLVGAEQNSKWLTS